MIFNYERLLNAPATAIQLEKRALKALSDGWRRGGQEPIYIDNKIDWKLENDNQRSWNYYKHSWAMIDEVLSAFTLLPDRLFLLVTAINVALDWSNKHIDDKGYPKGSVSKFAWYDMAVGLRAQRMAYIIDAGRYYKLLTPQQDTLLWKSLEAHQSYLENDDNIVFHNNHGYYQAAGQIAMGRRFKEVSESFSNAYEQGIERLKHMLVQQFTADGVHREHSPQYHYMVYSTLMKVLQAGLIEDSAISDFAKQIEAALSWFILPNQTLANIGDSYSLDMYEEEEEAVKNWQDEQMRYVVSDGKAGSLENTCLKVFEEGGYFVVRNKAQSSKDTKGYSTYSYLAQMAAFHSRTHKHADDLSFIWYDKGQSILIDAGRYGYIGKTKMSSDLWKQGYWYSDPYRIYCESTRAHNTLEFDGKDYPRVGVKPYGSATGRSKVYENGLIILETETKHFKSIRRVRVLLYMPNKWLIVYDWFKDNLDDNHDVRQWFNFDPKIKLVKTDNSYHALLSDNTELHVASLLGGAKGSVVKCGLEEPILQGWHSPEDGKFEPACSINYKVKESNTGSIATLFSFGEKPNVDLEENQTNVSGRRLKLAWNNSNGRHYVQLVRENEKEVMKCLYEVN